MRAKPFIVRKVGKRHLDRGYDNISRPLQRTTFENLRAHRQQPSSGADGAVTYPR